MSDTKIKRCPFCTSDNAWSMYAPSIYRDTPWFVYCEGCRAQGAATDNEAEAIAAWNRRTGENNEV